jgi:two-component system response regulator CpxR
MSRILLIDDDHELCELLIELLQPEGFTVETTPEPHNGLKRALSGEHLLIILDVMLPGMTGFELLQQLRKSSAIPVLMLTAKGDDIDLILGLELGADDYLAKPFNPRELVARIRAIRRRIDMDAASHTSQTPHLMVDDVQLDPGSRTVKQNNKGLDLTEIEFSLLYELLQQAGQVVSREELARTVLSREFESFDRSIDVHVSSLRRKLGNKINGRERIKTIRKVGYLYTRQEGY